ncbi:helix-turn-helix transcriptional regulator [Muricauda sp. 334s03]|uniref:Helix-turn-helix transcriptional regulator n=1 Tax=Flagellimonas yonaguniensis TaxID=3031325 RepID=A0ABT5Y0L5_9FLAO|nr:helix-turn-helix transcriptional regulator [[Muricauda] yonaguniensis]MDF0716990.1 helix-turn-helix transcriptional regulator [[Muricauda] yonaguniensis]
MRKYSSIEIELINIQIGCLLRLARLRKGLSQLDLGHQIDSNSMLVGRIERGKGKSSWEKIFMLSKQMDTNFCELFELRSKDDLLLIVEEALQYENKLTKDKREFYDSLKRKIEETYSSFNQEQNSN